MRAYCNQIVKRIKADVINNLYISYILFIELLQAQMISFSFLALEMLNQKTKMKVSLKVFCDHIG